MGQVKVEFEVINILNKDKKISSVGIVDTGATLLCLPRKMIEELELEYMRDVEVKTTNGIVSRRIYGGARIFIKDRSATVDVLEIDDNLPPLIGVVPLEVMDFVVYPDKLDLMPNPEHNNEYMLDLY